MHRYLFCSFCNLHLPRYLEIYIRNMNIMFSLPSFNNHMPRKCVIKIVFVIAEADKIKELWNSLPREWRQARTKGIVSCEFQVCVYLSVISGTNLSTVMHCNTGAAENNMSHECVNLMLQLCGCGKCVITCYSHAEQQLKSSESMWMSCHT